MDFHEEKNKFDENRRCETSPVTAGRVECVGNLAVAEIVSAWKHQFSYDISPLFLGIKELSLLRCKDTGYQFYWPMVEGDSALYEHLSKISWYYTPWKWEHTMALKFLKDGMSCLEIGSGAGGFIKGCLQKKQLRMTGLELNKESVVNCQKDGLNMVSETLETFSQTHIGEYDVVCSFQCIEHVGTVNFFLKASLKCLKPGGMLILSVPNNDGFVGCRKDLLNAPPHHQGLWSACVFEALERFFPVELQAIAYEPLQRCHEGGTVLYCEQLLLGDSKAMRITSRLTGVRRMLRWVVSKLQPFLIGHTMVAVYRKI